MSESITVFDVPLLVDLICAGLESKDIKNCVLCCKDWYTIFGPYRFLFVQLGYNNQAGASFLFENSHYIRGLGFHTDYLEFFDVSRCNRLRILRFSFEDTDDLGLGYHRSNNVINGQPNSIAMIFKPRDVFGRVTRIIEMIKRNQYLKELHIDRRIKDHILVTVLAPSMLRAIYYHPSLSKVKITMNISCKLLAMIVHHLPQQLHELEVDVGINRRYPPCCTPPCDRFMAPIEDLQIRRLFFKAFAECFMVLMFLPLLKRCPDLEELALSPVDSTGSRQDNFDEWVQVVDSNCPHLSTLSVAFSNRWKDVSSNCMSTFIQGFSRGFRQLLLRCGQRRNGEMEILKTIVSSATVNTIEVLRVYSWDYRGDQVILILRQCPRLRELRVRSGPEECMRVDVSDLIEATKDGNWACQDTLEVLELEMVNRNIAGERLPGEECRGRTALDVRNLFFWLLTFPRLTTLRLYWKLRGMWRGLKRNHQVDMNMLSLEVVNDVAKANELAPMTEEDMKWMGLFPILDRKEVAWIRRRL
ncbi:hypothetical protein BGX34_005173 [Mortierella sp. NVP85]|nr:hypothetical protein BGX34_005173 [Mortierella sp. NVP85]